ncbi:carbohydrate-binding module family 20 domain-containing protein [Pseudomonas sp. PB106]|uniref:carbohydrate-binding module family 20 domain-containing protein n=1 Tax=Pseudomonas sp. PB106 TaxID=2494699 RepID=UPI00131EB6C3|nr:carbohydrate-binding module family 20 domain-containing protein [Pseudomonas sp. PB106]KAE9639405.1 carbohydrate-binding protein [Pseudomonas sp. PB106]
MGRIRNLSPLALALSAMLPVVADAGATWTYLSLEATFRCENGTAAAGYSVYAVGDRAELGNGNTANAVRLSPSPYPTWSGKIKFSNAKPGDIVKWKCIVRNENPPYDVTSVQPAADNQVTLAFSNTLTTTGTF